MPEYNIPVEEPTTEDTSPNIPVETPSPLLSPSVAQDRATRATYGLQNKVNLGYSDYYSSFLQGQEQNVRNYIADRLDEMSAARKVEQIKALAQQGWPLTQEDISNVQNAYNDPKSVIEDHYAQKYVDALHWPLSNPDETHWWTNVTAEQPEFVKNQVDLGTEYSAKIQFLQMRQQEAHEEEEKQSWFGWSVDQLKNLTTLYPWIKMHTQGSNWYDLPGTAQENTKKDLLLQPYEVMKQRYDLIASSLPPGLRRQFADNMVGMSSSDQLMQDIFPLVQPGVEVSAVAGAAAAIFQRNAVRSAVRQQVQSSATQAGMSPAQQAAMSAGNMQQSTAQRAWGSLVNALRRSDPITEAEQKLPNIFRMGRQQALINDGGDINGTNRIIEEYDAMIAEAPRMLSDIVTPERVPALAERNPQAIIAAQQAVMDRSRDISSRVWNVSEPYQQPATKNWFVDLILGRSPVESFGSSGEAGRIASSFGLDGHRIEQVGNSYYIIKPMPVPEDSDAMRPFMAKLSTDKTPEGGIVNSFIARFRTPNETQSDWMNRNREAATFTASALEKYAWDQAEDIRKMQPLVPFTRGTEKWNEWERILNGARSVVDPDTNKIGYTYKNIGELEYAYRQMLGRSPDEQEIAAYFAFKRVNELDHAFRTISILKHKQRLGTLSHTITYRNPKLPGDVQVSPDFDAIPMDHFPGGDGRIAVVDDAGNVSVKRLNALGTAPSQGPNTVRQSYNRIYDHRVKNGTLKVVQIHAPEQYPLAGWKGIKSNDFVEYALVPPKMLSNKVLDWNTQLPWRGGGHFVYKYNRWIKQLDIREEVINGTKRQVLAGVTTGFPVRNNVDGNIILGHLNNIRTLMQKQSAQNIAAARDIAENQLNMNWADVKKWFSPPPVRNSVTGKWMPGSKPRFNLTEPFKLIGSNENLADLTKLEELQSRYSNFVDGRRHSPNQRFMTEFSQERDANELFTWNNTGTPDNPIFKFEPAELLDAIPTLNRAVNKIAKTGAMDDMKLQAVSTWIQEAKKYLSIDEDRLMSAPMYWFHHADFVKNATDARRIAELDAVRQQIKSFIGQVSQSDAVVGYWTQKLADSLYENKFTTKLANRLDPVNIAHTLVDPTRFLRAMTFHMKMGLFAIPQILVQGQTYVNILGISGLARATQGTVAALMHQWSRVNSNPNILVALGRHAEKFGWKPGEWQMIRDAGFDSGFFHVGSEYALRDHPMSNKIIQTRWGKFLELGAMPFTEGEKNVRFGAWYTAGKEFMEQRGRTGPLTNPEKLQILNRAAILNGNMNRASNAIYQRGWAALPAQFLTYTIRQAELMWGKRLNPAEKARLLLVNAMAYGLPVGLGISGLPSNFFRQAAIENGYLSGDNYVDTLINEGIPSTILALVDHDRYWNIGERFGNTGLNDLFYSDKTIWQLAGGAAGTSLASFLEAFDPFRQAIMSGLRQDGNQFTIQYEHLLIPLREITSFNSGERSYIAAKMGNWISKNGDSLLSGITPPEALMSFITGLQPQDAADIRHMQDIRNSEEEVQKWAERHAVAEAGRSLRAYDENNPDDGQAFMTNAMMYLNVYIPDDQKEQVLHRMFDRWSDVIERVRQSFGTTKVPPWLKDQRTDQFISSLQRNQ